VSGGGTPSVVFDCMVFLQATAAENGPAFRCLERFEAQEVDLFVSQDILDEVQDVLTRPQLQRKLSLLTNERVRALIERLQRRANLVAEVPKVFEYERDPKDEKYINLAIAAKAQYLVSRDLDLLDLMNETLPAGNDFIRRFPKLRIINPIAFLRELELRGGSF